ncbi:MAG: integrase arm-type DNA-binding domain-containing protein [Pseudomonadota bacterium]|nr:integrase arm-type DNA-binding domain-containing protein [Pseudomonadota bacterium]
MSQADRLTDRAIRNAKPAAKPYKLSDGRGMYLEITPTGGKRWRLKYRVDGKENRISLGVYPDIGLGEARDRRDDARKLVAKGVDPSAHRQAEKREAKGRAVNSFEVVAREWYEKQTHTWVESHASDVLRRLETNLFQDLGASPISKLTAPDLLECLRKIEERGARDLAHRVLQVCGQVFRYGTATGRCDRDIAATCGERLRPTRASTNRRSSRTNCRRCYALSMAITRSETNSPP